MRHANECAPSSTNKILINALLNMPKPQRRERNTPMKSQLSVLRPYIMKALEDGHKIVEIYETLAETGVFMGSYQTLRLAINEWRRELL